MLRGSNDLGNYNGASERMNIVEMPVPVQHVRAGSGSHHETSFKLWEVSAWWRKGG